MQRTSRQIWVRAFALSTGATALLAAIVGSLHFRLVKTGGEPGNHVTICDCLIDNARQTAVAMIRSSDQELPWRRRTYLIGLDLSSPPTKLTLPCHVLQPSLEPISVTAGPGGQLLVAAVDGGVYLVNPKRPSDHPVLVTRHDKPPYPIACSSDGRWLLALESIQLCAWDIVSGELRWRREGSDVQSVALVPNADLIVCGMTDGSVTELSLETGEEIRRITRHQAPVMNVTVSSDGDRVASCDNQEFCVIDR